jgi:glutamate--cysteine ligase
LIPASMAEAQISPALPARLLEVLADPAVRLSLADCLIGLEKEALRVAASGRVAATPHPAALGSPLTHPHITTDFSEALVELVTPALSSPRAVLDFLRDLHLFVYRHIEDERLWAASMPCVLHGGSEIPLARYGRSNAAEMKTVYRRGLGNRYGRVMQIIAGVHFNFSLPEGLWQALHADAGANADTLFAFRNAGYMGMVRNLQRLGWMVPYLFGASPAVCKSFVQDASTDLQSFDAKTYYYPFATSLRMGDIGYQNRQEEGTGLKANYDNLDAYTRSLTWAIRTPCPHYEHIGMKVNGRWEQLNDHVLQIENEYYSTVRPKQLTDWMEFPTLALRRRGIRYVELRSVDVNLFEPLGIELEQMRFLTLFMLYCLLLPSPTITARERRWIDANEVLAAHRGREPGLMLQRSRGAVSLRDWGREVLSEMEPLAELMDSAEAATPTEAVPGPFVAALRSQQLKMDEPDATPSARMLAEMRASGEGFAELARRWTDQHRAEFRQCLLDPAREALFQRLADDSRDRQAQIEASDDCSFDEFLARYFAQNESEPVRLRSPFDPRSARREEPA